MSATIKPEAGKRYVMRNGRLTGVILLANTHAYDNRMTWGLDGTSVIFPNYDLVAVAADDAEAASVWIMSTPQEPAVTTTRARILDTAKEYVTNDRQATHGKPEDTFGLIAAYWSAHLDTPVTSADVAAMMCLLKLARAKANPGNDDNWIDLAGYAACAGELVK